MSYLCVLKPPFKLTWADSQKTDFGWSITSAEFTDVHSKQVTKVRRNGTPGICKSRHPDKDSQWDIRLGSKPRTGAPVLCFN